MAARIAAQQHRLFHALRGVSLQRCVLVLGCSAFIGIAAPNSAAYQSIEARTARDDDQLRRQEELNSFPRFDRPSILAPAGPPLSFPRRVTESCIASLKNEDPAYDLAEIPLAEWVAAGEVTQIPWRFQVQEPRLRIDQRYEVSFSGRIERRDLRWPTDMPRELIYVTGIRNAGGEWVIPPKSAKYVFDAPVEGDLPDFRIVSNDCVFLQPGEYFVWSAVYDPENEKRTVLQRRVRTPEFKTDPLPQLNSRLPLAEFPKVDPNGGLAIEIKPGALFLPIWNSRPISVELVSVLSPSDQWQGRTDLVRWQNNRVLAVTSVLSQMRLGNGSVSVSAVDIVNQSVPFQQSEFTELDWSGLAAQFTQVTSDQVIALPALESAKKRSRFFREFLEKRLTREADALRVLILVSGSVAFERGSDLSAVKVAANCNCRVYHLLIRADAGDAFDHIERLIKPLRPKTFDIESALDFREALGKIVQDLENL